MSKFMVGDRVKTPEGEGIVTHYDKGGDCVVQNCGDHGWWDVNLTLIKSAGSDCSEPTSIQYPAYYKDVSSLNTIDVYAVHKLFGIDDPSGAIQHASKKLLLSGVRTGGKSKVDDVREARDTLTRWLELEVK